MQIGSVCSAVRHASRGDFFAKDNKKKVIQKLKRRRKLTRIIFTSLVSRLMSKLGMRRESIMCSCVKKLQQMSDFMREGTVVIDADEFEVGLIDGFVVAAEAVVVSTIGEFVVG